jgi:two-component system response regulator MtrA
MTDAEPTILIVEDDPAVAEMVEKVLLGMGIKVFVAENGSDAIKSFETNRPDLVLLDIALPDINGFEVAKKIRQTESTDHHTHITIMTAYAQSFFVSMGFEAGIDGYLNKPILPQDIINQVESLIA